MGSLLLEPDEDERAMWEQMDKEGLPIGVYDPDFPDPLEGTLHVDRGIRYVLRIECEDESLNSTRPVHQLRAERRDNVAGGHGVALVAAADGGVLQVLVLDNAAGRDCLVRMVETLHEDQRFYRRARKKKPLLGCVPVGCLGGCARPRPVGEPGERAESEPPVSRTSSFSEECRAASAGRSGFKKASSQQVAPWTSSVETSKEWAQSLWVASQKPRTRKGSRSFVDYSFVMGSFPKSQDPKDGPRRTFDPLDTERCTHLLFRVVCDAEPPTGAGHAGPDITGPSSNELPGGSLVSCLHLFPTAGDDDGTVTFDEFWEVCTRSLLLDKLWAEPLLRRRQSEDDHEEPGRHSNSHHRLGLGTRRHSNRKLGEAQEPHLWTVEKWRWFLVKVQDEEREVVEAAEKVLEGMGPPDVQEGTAMTLVGVARYLCSAANSLFRPVSKQAEALQHPLTEYWIAASHHIYADPYPLKDDVMSCVTPQSAPNNAHAGDIPLHALNRALRANCRCLSLALISDSGGEGDTEPFVLLQMQRVPLDDVLRFIAQSAFSQGNELPLLLVLSLTMLAPAACAVVPEALREHLGGRLWRSTEPELPSPEAAQGHVIVVLSPAARGSDPGLVPRPKPKASVRSSSVLDSTAAMPTAAAEASSLRQAAESWRAPAAGFAVWPGVAFDEKFARKSQHDVRVGFVASDRLRLLEESKRQQLVEHHRETLSLVHPSAYRNAPTGFNAAGAWATGAQLAALPLSWSCGGADLVHAGRFSGHCGSGGGYVLKPPHMRSGGADSMAPPPVKLELRVIAGRAIPGLGGQAMPSSLTSLAVGIAGAHEDCAREVFRPAKAVGPVISWSELVSNDGKAGKTLAVFTIGDPSAAVLTFEVLQMDMVVGGPRRIAAYAAPVSAIRGGFRWVPLWGPEVSKMRPTGHGQLSGLLVHAVIKREARRRR